MQIKPSKLEFFVAYHSGHPKHYKINVIKNMIQNAMTPKK